MHARVLLLFKVLSTEMYVPCIHAYMYAYIPYFDLRALERHSEMRR